jgi:hypothetical protein
MYVGEHNMDERTGFGKMVWPDGAEYGGVWRNGVLVEAWDNLDFSQVIYIDTSRFHIVQFHIV